jgi:hypothetical protein
VDEIEAHPQEVAHMVEHADAHGVITREQFMLTTRANPRQLDEIIREGPVQGLGGAKKRSQERKEDPLGVAPGDGCYSKQQGNMRPPQSKTQLSSQVSNLFVTELSPTVFKFASVQLSSTAPWGLSCGVRCVFSVSRSPHRHNVRN